MMWRHPLFLPSNVTGLDEHRVRADVERRVRLAQERAANARLYPRPRNVVALPQRRPVLTVVDDDGPRSAA